MTVRDVRATDPAVDDGGEERNRNRDNIEACNELLRLLILHHPDHERRVRKVIDQ
jgi:hypothetical protein